MSSLKLAFLRSSNVYMQDKSRTSQSGQTDQVKSCTTAPYAISSALIKMLPMEKSNVDKVMFETD
jgi:hypothetical protein